MAEELEAIDLSEYQPDYGMPVAPRRRGSLTGRFPIYAPTGGGASPLAAAQPTISPADQALLDKLPDKDISTVADGAPIVTASRNRIERALSLSATLNIPFADAYDNADGLSAAMDGHDPNWFKTAGSSFMRGIGNLYVTAGKAAEWLGADASTYTEFGQRLQRAYMPTMKPQEFTWKRIIDPGWWATTVAESVPSSLALIPASIIGAYAGFSGAAAAGLGAFGRLALGSLGGAVVARSGEAALEAGQGYEEALRKGKTRAEADAIANNVFTANLALTGADVAEFALAFTPLGMIGARIPAVLKRRGLATLGKLGAVGIMEGGEEAIQEAIQQWARGDPITVTPEMKESFAVGALFGVGLGGAGSVYDGLTRRVESRMPAAVAQQYQESIAARAAAGTDIDTAKREALDELALSPEGQKIVNDTIQELKDIAEGKVPAPKTQVEMDQAIEGVQDADSFAAADLPQAEIDALMAQNFEAIARGELSVEELLGEVASGEELTARQGLAERPNILVSEEAFQAARQSLREKTSGLHAGIDPTAIVDMVKIGTYYVERGVRNFADWAATMVETFGNVVEPYLAQVWQTVERRSAAQTAGEEKAREILGGKIGRTDRQGVAAAIEDHIRALTESPVELIYRGERFQKAVKEKTGVRLIGDRERFVTGNKVMEIEEAIPFDISGEAISERPLSKSALEFKAMARELERAKQPVRDVKAQVKLTTGQTRVMQMIREDVALRAAFKMAERASRQAFSEGSKAGLAAARADMEDIVLKARIAAQWKGIRAGYKFGETVTGQRLRELFREKEKHSQETRAALVDLIQEHLPPELRGKFLDAVVAKVTEKHTNDLLDRIEAAGNKASKAELLAELGALKQRRGAIDVEYKKRIDTLLADINTKKITPATREKLEGLLEYAQRNGMPSGISGQTQLALRRLEMRQADDMTNLELKELRDIAEHLTALGKVKQKLKNRYNERERQKNLNALIGSTTNLDPKVSGQDTQADRWRQGSLDLYVDLLTPLRALEMADGYRKGVNYQYGARIGHAETEAQWNARKELQEATNELMALGITEIDEGRNDAVMANIRAMEGAETAMTKIMEKNGWTELPELSEKEKAMIEVLRKYSNRKQAEVAALYEERTNEVFVKLDSRILPLKYEGEFNLAPDEVMLHTPHRSTQTEQGFTVERKAGVTKMPRTDVMGVFEQGINEREWWLAVQPELDNIAELVNTKQFADAAGAVITNYWRDHLDIVSRRGWDAKARHTPFAKALRDVRGNISKAILGWRISSILMQPFAVFDALSYAAAEWGPSTASRILGEFAKTWASPEHFKQIKAESKALQMRTGGELSIDEILAGSRSGGWKDTFVRNGLSLMQAGDVRTAAAMKAAVQKIFEDRGVANAGAEADTIMQLVSSSSDVAFRPHILAKGEGARTWFTFQTFMLNRFGIVAHDLVNKTLVHGDAKKKIAALVGLGILIAGKMAEDDAREFIYETVKQRQLPDRGLPLWVRALFAVPSSVPTFGNLFEIVSSRGGSSEMPIIKLINDIGRGLTARFKQTEKSKPETAWKALLAGIEAGAVVVGGVPGTSQGFDILEGLLFPEKEKSERRAAAPFR